MPIKLVCENCSTAYQLKDSSAGQSLTCKQCGRLLTVPSDASSAAAEESDDDRPFSNRPLDADELIPEGWADSRQPRPTPAATRVATQPQASSHSLKTRRFVLAMVLLLIALFVNAWVGSIVLEGMRSSSWPSVEGTVVRSKAIRYGKGFRLDFRYRYRVNGASYDSERVTVAGNSHLFCESPYELSGKYQEKASVRVSYNPRNPEAAALQPGVPMGLGAIAVVLFLLGSMSVLFAWASSAELFGPPRPLLNPDVEDPRSIPQRALIAVFGVLVMLFAGCIAGMCLMLPVSELRNSRDAFTMVFTTVFGVLFAGLMSLLGWFGSIVFKSAFKRPETINDLRNAPDSPTFSNSSLICFAASLGSSTAVIVDHDKGMIHFKKCFTPRKQAFFSGLTVPWMSCSLDLITGLSQTTYKGATTFNIETEHGKASVSTLIPNYEELRQFLENRPLKRSTRRASVPDEAELSDSLLDPASNSVAPPNKSAEESLDRHANEQPRRMLVRTTSAMGGEPLDWRVSMCILGGVFGPFVGMGIGSTVGSRDLGSCALWGILLGGCSGLPFFVASPRQLGRFAASRSGITTSGGLAGVLVYFLLKLFIRTQLLDLVVLTGAGALLGFLFARQRKK